MYLVVVSSFSFAQQKINGPTTVCANTPTRYTFSGVCPGVSQWSAAPGVILTAGTGTAVTTTFPAFTVDKTYRLFADYTCSGGSGQAINIKKIVMFASNTSNATININDLLPDVYILRIRNKDTWISKKFVVAPH